MSRLYIIILLFGFINSHAQEIKLDIFGQGFSSPVDISHAGDERLFITEKAGTIRILNPDGSKPNAPFLNIVSRVNSSASERGLLGLCFHPDYKQNRYFFVHYTNSSGHSTISRFTTTENPNVADPNSEKIIMVVNQPFSNHNAGDLEFGHDGYLYIGMGDGGSGGDPGNRSQDPKNLLGKMLRIDINTDGPYEIPTDNPWAGNADTLPEIWAFGIRNPWRFSFDRETGDLWIGDVGQNRWEEINYAPHGAAGINYGWRCYEGFETYNATGCKDISFYTPPVFVFRNPTLGCSVTGGFVYRGPDASRHHGKYFLTDYCSGRFWTVQKNGQGDFEGVEIGKFLTDQYVSFGENFEGKMYVAAIRNGNIYIMSDPKCSYLENDDFIQVKQMTCHDACDASIIAGDLGSISSYEWSTGEDIAIIDGLCPGVYTLTVTDTIGCRKSYDLNIEHREELLVEISLAGSQITANANLDISLYEWYRNDTLIQGVNGRNLETTMSGTYYVLATDDRQCTKKSNSIDILDCSYLQSMVSLSAIQPTCHDSCDGQILLESSAQIVSYLWVTAQTGPNINGLCPGDYSVTVTDVNGCSAIVQTTIDTVLELTVELQIAGQFLEAFANQDVTYQWYRNGELIPGATDKTFQPELSGEYYVIVTNDKGCTEQSVLVTITGTENESGGKMGIRYNSLSQDGIQFSFDQSVKAKVSVFDVNGRVVQENTDTFTAHQWHKINVNAGRDGYYFLHFSIDKRQYVYKVFLKF